MRALIACLMTLCLAPLVASDSIRVPLSTDNRLLPVYLAAFERTGGGLPAGYASELREVLAYDLSQNGATTVLAVDEEVDTALRRSPLTQAGDTSLLRGRHVFYLLRGEIRGQQLHVHLFSLGTGKRSSVKPISLSGDLSRDRRRVHALADWVHQTLFGSPGIATTSILYTVRTPNPHPSGQPWLSEVWECDWDGHNQRPITRDGHYCVTPCYLPAQAGRRPSSFFYVSYRTGQPKIYIGSLKDGASQRLTYLRGNQLMPTLNNDRNLVAFISDASGNPDLFMQQFSPEAGPLGKPMQVFAAPGATQGTPTFSPDGRQVAFVSNKAGSPRIYVMDLPADGRLRYGLPIRLITRLNSESVSPAWSPDGTKLAYSSRVQGVRQIWVYDFAQGRERQLTEGPKHKENPSWAPNSLHLVYNTESRGECELFVMNLNEKRSVRICPGSTQRRFPSWEPRLFSEVSENYEF